MLDEIKSMNPSNPEFKAKVEQLMMALQTHVSQEENEMFPKIRDNFSHEQHKQMATEFKTVKSKLQVQIAATKQ
jgi:hemerythrin-like domain-containing protein